MRIFAKVFAALMVSVLPAHASDAAKEQLFAQISIEDALGQFPAYRKQRLSFDFDGLDFTTIVPEGAKVETAPMGPYDPKKQFGKVINTARVGFDVDGSAVEGVVTAFTMVQTAEAPAFCSYLAAVRGFDTAQQMQSTDLTDAQIHAVGRANDGGKQAMIGRCLVRGHSGLAFLFRYRLAEDTVAGMKSDRVAAKVTPILSAMTFSDGKPVSFWPEMGSVDVVFAGEVRSWTYPLEWSIAFNDHGENGTELMFMKKSTDDARLDGFIWLSEIENFDAADFDLVFSGKALIAKILREQLGDSGAPVWTSVENDPSFSGVAQIAKRFSFLVTDKNDKLAGQADGALILRGSSLFVSLYFSDEVESLDLNPFFTRLPTVTAIDILDAQIRDALMQNAAPH